MSRLKLMPWQRHQLERQLESSHEARAYRRILAVLEYAQGGSIARIARLLRVSRQSVYNWIERYAQTGDPASLADALRTGRPPRWDGAAEARLRRLLMHTPERFGYLAVNWTVLLLAEQLHETLGHGFSDDTVRRALHRLGYGWKRSRYVLMPDAQAEKKTADSPRDPGAAAAQRAARRG